MIQKRSAVSFAVLLTFATAARLFAQTSNNPVDKKLNELEKIVIQYETVNRKAAQASKENNLLEEFMLLPELCTTAFDMLGLFLDFYTEFSELKKDLFSEAQAKRLMDLCQRLERADD